MNILAIKNLPMHGTQQTGLKSGLLISIQSDTFQEVGLIKRKLISIGSHFHHYPHHHHAPAFKYSRVWMQSARGLHFFRASELSPSPDGWIATAASWFSLPPLHFKTSPRSDPLPPSFPLPLPLPLLPPPAAPAPFFFFIPRYKIVPEIEKGCQRRLFPPLNFSNILFILPSTVTRVSD